jgi:hypothetical protein
MNTNYSAPRVELRRRPSSAIPADVKPAEDVVGDTEALGEFGNLVRCDGCRVLRGQSG